MKAPDHGRADSKTHYEALCVREDATYSEIRSQYRFALIALHPDKKQFNPSQSASSNANLIKESKSPITEAGKEKFEFFEVGEKNSCSFLGGCQGIDTLSELYDDAEILERFLRVQKAWEVLKDVKSREAYDYQLQAVRHIIEVVANEIELDEMSTEEDRERGAVEYFYPCRCGDYFVIAEAELVEMGFRASKWEGDGTSGFPLNEVSIQGTKQEAGMWEASTYRAQNRIEQKAGASLERRSVTLPCGSCSLRTRLSFDAILCMMPMKKSKHWSRAKGILEFSKSFSCWCLPCEMLLIG